MSHNPQFNNSNRYSRPNYSNEYALPSESDMHFYSDNEKKQVKSELFVKTAEDIAKAISTSGNRHNSGMTTTQLRRFYHKVLYFRQMIENKAQTPEERQKEFVVQQPFINMLLPTVVYAVKRSNSNVPVVFQKFLEINLRKNVNDWNDFVVFCYLFEAVVGYFQQHGKH